MQNPDDKKVDRRTFIQTAGVVAGSAIASTAVSYDRILGANDRIALGHIGIGNRGGGLHKMASRLNDKYNVETVDNGFLHAVAVIMAAESYWQGKRLYYDSAAEQILDRAPTH